MYFRHLVLALCLSLLSGCGLIDYFFLPPPEDTAQELYEGATDAMRDKNYSQAVEYYSKLKDNYPFSPYTVEAELALGDALFLNEKYTEAADAYKDFESLHPRHEAIPYVLYQIGMSDLKSFTSVDRSTTAAAESIEYFKRLQETYPESEYALKAAPEIANARRIIAEHELYLGDVFWNMKQYGPAWRRYTYIVDNFPDVPEVQDHARQKSMSAYYKYREQQSHDAREQIEGSWKKWFDWL